MAKMAENGLKMQKTGKKRFWEAENGQKTVGRAKIGRIMEKSGKINHG